MKISPEVIELAKKAGACEAGILVASHPDATWETLPLQYVTWAAERLDLPEAERDIAYRICGIIRNTQPYVPPGYLFWPNESRLRCRLCLTPAESEPMIPV